jgi:hypothetical protein
MQHQPIIDHAHPAALGAVATAFLPWDHATNLFWAVAGSVLSWAAVRACSALVQHLTKKKKGKHDDEGEGD